MNSLTKAVASRGVGRGVTGAPARPRTASDTAAAAIGPRRPAAAAVAEAGAPSPSPRRTSRRHFITPQGNFSKGMFQASAAGASLLGSKDELAATRLSRSLSSAVARPSSGSLSRSLNLPRATRSVEQLQPHPSGTQDMAQDLASSSNILPLPLKPLRPLPGGAVTSSSPLAPPPRRVLQLHSTAELEQAVVSNTCPLLVVSFALDGCPFSEAMLPWLSHAAQRHPEALVVRLTVDAAGDEASELLLSELSVSALPVTLLLTGQQLLARLEVGAAGSRPPEAAAREAALELHSAIMAAKLLARLQGGGLRAAG